MDLIFTNKRFPVLLPPVCKYHFQQLVAECFCAAVVEKQLRNNGLPVPLRCDDTVRLSGGVGVSFFSVNRLLLSLGVKKGFPVIGKAAGRTAPLLPAIRPCSGGRSIGFGDTVEVVLVGFIPVVVIQIQSFRHFQSLLSK